MYRRHAPATCRWQWYISDQTTVAKYQPLQSALLDTCVYAFPIHVTIGFRKQICTRSPSRYKEVDGSAIHNIAARAKPYLILLPLHDGEETPNCGSLCWHNFALRRLIGMIRAMKAKQTCLRELRPDMILLYFLPTWKYVLVYRIILYRKKEVEKTKNYLTRGGRYGTFNELKTASRVSTLTLAQSRDSGL